jgi:hypothetical protein
VAGSCEYGDEPSGSDATKLVSVRGCRLQLYKSTVYVAHDLYVHLLIIFC